MRKDKEEILRFEKKLKKIGNSAWEDVMMVSQNLRDNFRGLETAEINTIGFLAFSFSSPPTAAAAISIILFVSHSLSGPFKNGLDVLLKQASAVCRCSDFCGDRLYCRLACGAISPRIRF